MKRNVKILLAATLCISLSAAAFSAGSMVVYSPNSDGEIQGILNYFGEHYGIKISLQSMGTGECLSKLNAEKANPQADVMFGGVNMGVYLTNKDIFQQYVAKNNAALPAGYQNTTGYITNYLLSGSCLLVNTDQEKQLGLNITGYDDLLNPALKGKIASANPVESSSAWAQLCNILLDKGGYESPQAWSYVESLIKQLNGKLTSGSSAVYKGVYQGEYVVGLTYEDPSVALLADGATNVRVVYPKEGAVWLPAASAIVAGCKNTDNAKLFMDFLVTDECQKIVAGLTNRPVNTKIANTNKYLLPLSQIKLAFEDIPFTSSHKKALQQRWADLWAKLN